MGSHNYAIVGSIPHTTAFGIPHDHAKEYLFGHDIYIFDHAVCSFKTEENYIYWSEMIKPWYKWKAKGMVLCDIAGHLTHGI